MGRSLIAHKPVATAFINAASTTIEASTDWTTFVASLGYACSGVIFYNTATQGVLVGTGAAAAEVGLFYIPPSSNTGFIPVVIKKGVRVALQSAGTDITSGTVAATFFG